MDPAADLPRRLRRARIIATVALVAGMILPMALASRMGRGGLVATVPALAAQVFFASLYIRLKGRSWAWGLLGILGILGLFLLLMMDKKCLRCGATVPPGDETSCRNCNAPA